MKKVIIAIVVVVLLLIGSTWFARNAEGPSEDGNVISTRGIHTHPELAIFINDVPYTIPANIGLVGAHQAMHTHATDGVIHIETGGIVRERDIMLGRFFEIWGQEFSSTTLIDRVGEVQMTVNGRENTEFGDYQMQDGDKIELRIQSTDE